MKKKIGILLENRFIDKEIIYYASRFEEEGFPTEFLTRLWGNPSLTFKGLELNYEVTVDKSFEEIDDERLNEYAAIITPAGYVADYLLYAHTPGEKSPAAKFIERAMHNKNVIKGFICHSLWLAGPLHEVFKGREVTCHNNIISHVTGTGAIYKDKDIHIDDDLVSARHGGLHPQFARAIIEKIL